MAEIKEREAEIMLRKIALLDPGVNSRYNLREEGWVDLEELSEELGVCVSAVRKLTKRWEKMGIVEKKLVRDPSKGANKRLVFKLKEAE